MYFKQFYDEKLAQYAYLIGCQANGTAVIIDPMRDIDQYIEAAANENLTIVAAADTHIHADYISGLREFAERGIKVYASDEGDPDWKYEWLKNSHYDYVLLKNGDSFNIGNIRIKAWHTPGHTPEHLSYFVTDGAAADEPLGLITGDFIFVGDVGRPDLLESAAGQKDVMKSSAQTLYKSVKQFRDVSEHLQVWPGHGAGSACGKALGAVPGTTVGYELRYNQSLRAADTEENFVNFILDGQPEPPLYFARMKRDNKMGPVLSGGLPSVKRMTIRELAGVTEDRKAVILDTRERTDYAAGHLPGSVLSPLNRQFNTVAGSYITEEDEIYLIVGEHQVKEAVRDLYRIGLDNIRGYATPQDLRMYAARFGELKKREVISFDEMENRISETGSSEEIAVLDVRSRDEYNKSHVDGAINLAHTRLLELLEKVPAGKKLLVHCETGGRSAVAASLLERTGHDVTLVDDEFSNYRNPQPDPEIS